VGYITHRGWESYEWRYTFVRINRADRYWTYVQYTYVTIVAFKRMAARVRFGRARSEV